MKDNIKRMEAEQGLYAQVIILRQKYLNFFATYKNKNELNSSFKVNWQDQNVGLILKLIGSR